MPTTDPEVARRLLDNLIDGTRSTDRQLDRLGDLLLELASSVDGDEMRMSQDSLLEARRGLLYIRGIASGWKYKSL